MIRALANLLFHRTKYSNAGDAALYVKCSCGWEWAGWGDRRVDDVALAVCRYKEE